MRKLSRNRKNETTSNQIENVDGYSANNVHVKGTDEELYFNSTSAIKDVYISGRWIDPANYSLSTDGKTLTLNAAFLNQLAYGSYTMQIDCTNGSTVTCVFSIAATIIASGTCGENLTWTLDESGLLTISGTGAMTDYGLFRGKPAPWHEHRDKIKTVLIESGVTSIGDDAFAECSEITSVTIPDGVTNIGSGALKYCTALTSVTIPDSVTSIGKMAFADCTALTSIEVASDNEYYSVLDGVLFNKDTTELVCFPAGRAGASYTIPDSVTSIGEAAFSICTAPTKLTVRVTVVKTH